MRLHAIGGCALLATGLQQLDIETVIIPMIHAAGSDPSWKVRLAVAANLADVGRSLLLIRLKLFNLLFQFCF